MSFWPRTEKVYKTLIRSGLFYFKLTTSSHRPSPTILGCIKIQSSHSIARHSSPRLTYLIKSSSSASRLILLVPATGANLSIEVITAEHTTGISLTFSHAFNGHLPHPFSSEMNLRFLLETKSEGLEILIIIGCTVVRGCTLETYNRKAGFAGG
jgi:hypothetical protein